MACPITSVVKAYPFEVSFSHPKLTGVVLADQLRTLDWKERRVVKIGRVSASVLNTVQKHLSKLILE